MAAKDRHGKGEIMKLCIPTEPTFIIPEGNYRAVLINVINLEDKKQVRLLFRVFNSEGKLMNAGKNYNTQDAFTRNGDLRRDLMAWRGRDLTDEEIQSGTFDLETLLGQQADLVINQRRNPKFDKPYVYIAQIHPPGSIVPEAPVAIQPLSRHGY
jgi:hypothetical protein